MLKFKAHPWHGISPGPDAPETITAFVEIVPSDTVKYEIDKATGYLKIDRPQRFSNVVPALYGFVPQTYCAEEVAARCMAATNKKEVQGDGDPLDIMVLTEHHLPHGDILVQARPIGGLRMIDKGEADDKVIAVLRGDALYETITDISQLPDPVVDRLRHYFLTYKLAPGSGDTRVEIAEVYGAEEARAVILASLRDYQRHFPA